MKIIEIPEFLNLHGGRRLRLDGKPWILKNPEFCEGKHTYSISQMDHDSRVDVIKMGLIKLYALRKHQFLERVEKLNEKFPSNGIVFIQFTWWQPRAVLAVDKDEVRNRDHDTYIFVIGR